jgi:hypothetical protein
VLYNATMPTEQDNREERQHRIDRMVAELAEIERAATRLAEKLRDEAATRELVAVQQKAAHVAAELSALANQDDDSSTG